MAPKRTQTGQPATMGPASKKARTGKTTQASKTARIAETESGKKSRAGGPTRKEKGIDRKGVDDKLKTVNGKEIADTEVLIDLAKGPNNGSFMCPRCFYGCTRQRNLDEHFPKCVETYGNPDRLSNNSHPSYRGERGEEIACQPSDVEYARGWLFYVDSRSDAENAIGWCLWINPRGWYTNSRPDVVYASAWHRWFNSRKDK